MSGYVDQQDLHVSTATVHEAVMTSALLRLPRSMSLRDSRIGKSGARGISGGEMRRVSIACELVTSPSIIFLDEPTSGLDAYNAYVVMDTLSQLARRYGRTVICTIHQPRTDIFSMFDRLIILAAGQMCYSGPANTMVQYLESIGHPVPEGYNIADFSIDLVQQATVSGKKKEGKEQIAITAELKPVKLVDDEVDSEYDEWSKLAKDSPELLPSPAEDSQPAPKFLSKSNRQGSQFLVYDIEVSLERLVENFTESKQYIEMTDDLNTVTGAEWTPSEFKTASSTYGGTPYTRPVTPYQQVAVILINLRDLAYLFYRRLRGERISDTFNDKHRPTVYEQFKVLSARIFNHLYRDPTLMLANYALSVFIGLMCGVLFYQLDNSIQGMQNRLGLLMFILAFYGFGCTTSLLRANAYYDPLAYFMAKVTFDLIPLRVVPPLLLTLIAYPMTGLSATASQMFFIGLLAEELVVSNFIASIMLLFSLLFGGLILNKDSMPAIIQPLCHVSSFNLAYEAMAISELRFATVEEVRFGLEIQVPSAALLSSFGFDVLAFWPDIGILLERR
ncbi:hypothetical protein DL89DRAFT_269361 [Linderina pennispora]|uniref:ABC transporter domain-containing protein n=1 Tax=Linderina pennispora TaxID=61395 RepID=A0A1Y1W2A9_9FUNG|nr:uncharacterized protein DL89DRAFT_269361 [Linderina pennispora]ORX67562.1 hypothetical protein DL89DRAFT_269361 [Linderina pennispora]